MSAIVRILCAMTGIALVAFGFYALFAIGTVTELTALSPVGIAGNNEARAIYAGSFWAMGGLILHAMAAPAERAPVLWAVGVIFAGFVLARFVSIAMDGYDPALAPAIISEAAAAVILIVGGVRSSTTARS